MFVRDGIVAFRLVEDVLKSSGMGMMCGFDYVSVLSTIVLTELQESGCLFVSLDVWKAAGRASFMSSHQSSSLYAYEVTGESKGSQAPTSR